MLRRAATAADDDAAAAASSSSRQFVVVDKCSMLPGIKWQCLVADLENQFLLQIRTPNGPPLNQPVPLADLLSSQEDLRVTQTLPITFKPILCSENLRF